MEEEKKSKKKRKKRQATELMSHKKAVLCAVYGH